MATALKKAGIEAPLIQYVCPQVWAWKKNRIPKIVENYDEVLCLLPFEPEIFAPYKNRSDFQATFIGHPIIDELPIGKTLNRNEQIIALMPGSRKNEITKLLPTMIDSALKIREKHPKKNYQFHIPAATPAIQALIEEMAPNQLQEDWLHFHPEGAHHLMQTANAGIIASGTATLEASCLNLPYVLIYKMNSLTHFVARNILKIGKVGLINVLAKKFIVKELIQSDASPQNISQEISTILTNKTYRNQMIQDMESTRKTLGPPGSHQKICDRLQAQITAKTPL